jgi:diguanylate cyclase (GGDEF)-like protein
MATRLVQRIIVAAMVLATLGAAVAVHIASTRGLHRRSTHRVQAIQHRLSDAVQRRTYFLEDLADMVGVHDDAAAAEFSRYAHVRGRDERAVVSVQWVRRAPDAKLVPPAAPDPNPGPTPTLIAPVAAADGALADAAAQRAAAHAIGLASLHKTVAVSAPVTLADGHPAFYLAVPVQARRYSGLLSNAESQSAIVGLVDAQTLVEQALGGGAPALRLRDRVTPLAAVGSGLHNALSAALPVAGRRWTITVAGASLTPFQIALPWLIALLGFSLAGGVAAILRTAARRRDEALQLADDRLSELTVSLERLELTNRQLEIAHDRAEARSRIDELTGIFNRREFTEALSNELAGAQSASAAVLLLDIDHFKQINDEHGHLIGDVILRAVAARVGAVVRLGDCLARWGGEEFAILALNMDDEGMFELAERARRAVGDDPIVVDGLSFELHVSVGAALSGARPTTVDALVGAADEALYEAKRAGRDCVRVHDSRAGASERS